VTYQRVKSEDLTVWLPDSVTENVESIHTEWERVTVPVTGDGKGFRRVGVNR
jgi:hypothetical protein